MFVPVPRVSKDSTVRIHYVLGYLQISLPFARVTVIAFLQITVPVLMVIWEQLVKVLFVMEKPIQIPAFAQEEVTALLQIIVNAKLVMKVIYVRTTCAMVFRQIKRPQFVLVMELVWESIPVIVTLGMMDRIVN